jgi:hypothetical protein
MFHYGCLTGDCTEDYKKEGNTEFLKSGRAFSKITTTSICELKRYLLGDLIPCRY